MKIHILGACGTFMGGVAMLAKRAGHEVSGADQHTYPPMSTLLENEGIALYEGYGEESMVDTPDLVIIGNALSRGNPAVEYVLSQRLNYTSGPRWLGENYLRGRNVIAVAGTHGKTTTSSMVAWILDYAGLSPGFLIGGVPLNFNVSAREGSGYFVVEADEYDTAFFDKRSKFVHYRPEIAILNNLEYDHADIFPDLAAIETQFHHLMRTIPSNGTVISNAADANLENVLGRGYWSNLQRFSLDDEHDWQVELLRSDGSELRFSHRQQDMGSMAWDENGHHNATNACAAIAAAVAAGVPAATAIEALSSFRGVKRRMELISKTSGIHVYDDFAHHPTAIRLTLEGLRRKVGNARILVALEPRSNSMRAGVHADELGPALIAADYVWLKTSDGIDWDPQVALAPLEGRCKIVTQVDDMLRQVKNSLKTGDHVVFMSNGGFEAAPGRLSESLKTP
ncbi:MAG: UDP-N-acetylmuramate:L-alanyl-gamma-D-glutamyl-meso-diaminopimelate ligase [Gammaproteobacteria bacterium]|nr:MAG: UDP-N-acetylmuramate:L-alanyl-gamma-D-glutamyl-meso-diaminopimelate ligase [Gammaproteobacteria bacterium]